MLPEKQHRFSVTDYYRMAEAGVLGPDARVELLHGQVIDMSPIGPFHGSVTKQLLQLFAAAAHGRWLMAAQDPLHLDDHSEPEPDLMLLKPARDFYRHQHPRPEDVYLLIEISDTTLAADQEVKLPAYGHAGVAEVWIVNLMEERLEVYRDPNFTGYGSKQLLVAGDQAAPMAFPDVLVNVAALFRF
jgi:Uma2 family endonuclease